MNWNHTGQRFFTIVRSTVVFAAVLLFAWNGSVFADENNAKSKRLAVGEKAINFDLPVVGEDRYIELKEEYKKGTVIVVVLRGFPGYQCMLCKQQVGNLINRARSLKEKVHKIILVYPGPATGLERHAEQFMGSRSIPEPLIIVRDPNLEMVTKWGLRWNAPRETAYPATYIIKQSGRVAWSKVSTNHGGRTTADELVRQLRKL